MNNHSILSALGDVFTPVSGKKPYISAWQKTPKSLEFCQSEVASGNATGFGLVTGNRIVAIDFDGDSAIKIAEVIGGWLVSAKETTLAWTSGKIGYYQVAYRIPEVHLELWEKVTYKQISKLGNAETKPPVKNSQGKITEKGHQLEIRYKSVQSVLPPSIHPDTKKPYQWLNETEIVTLTEYQSQCLLNAINYKSSSEKPSQELSKEDLERLVLSALEFIPNDNYDTWIDVGMALKESGFDCSFWDSWSSSSSKYESGQCEKKWESFNSSGKTLGTLFYHAQWHGFNQKQWMRENLKFNVTSDSSQNNGNNKNKTEKIDPIDEVREILVNNYSSRLRFNELKKIVELDGEEAFLDDFYLKIHKDYGVKISKQIAYDLAVMFAKERSYHPIKNYLNNLQPNSQDLDIKKLSSTLFGTTDPIYDEMLYRHLIGSVARVYKQGCKLDTALILQGKQGIGKSTFFKLLYGEEFFTDSVNGTDKDNLLILHQHWCAELAEFEAITGKKASGELKAFLSKSVDTYREPYARSSRTIKRQCVIVELYANGLD
jgi:hypothetical protein